MDLCFLKCKLTEWDVISGRVAPSPWGFMIIKWDKWCKLIKMGMVHGKQKFYFPFALACTALCWVINVLVNVFFQVTEAVILKSKNKPTKKTTKRHVDWCSMFDSCLSTSKLVGNPVASSLFSPTGLLRLWTWLLFHLFLLKVIIATIYCVPAISQNLPITGTLCCFIEHKGVWCLFLTFVLINITVACDISDHLLVRRVFSLDFRSIKHFKHITNLLG